MRGDLLIAVALLPFLGSSPQQPQEAQPPKAATARIAGRVVAADTGRPLKGAVLQLVSYEVMRVAKSAVTDAQGRYEFTGLLAGRYQLEASAERYLGLQYGQRRPPEPGKPIDLREGERFEAAVIALPRAGAIEGRLLDEFNDPAPNIIVQASRLEFVAGRHRLLPLGSRIAPRPTDDKGQFRIAGLGPGSYYLCALSGAFTEQNEVGGFAPTYYPGTAEVSEARPVRLGFGESATNLTITLVPARMARVAGALVDPSGRPVARGTVMLFPSDSLNTVGFMAARGTSGPDGAFVFRNVPPGTYTIQAFGSPVGGGSLGQAPFGWLRTIADGTDVTGLVVKVAPGVTARGRIVFEGDTAPPPNRDEVRVSPRPIEFDSTPVVGGGGPPQTISNDWTFEVRNLSGLRVIRVDVNPPEWSLARIEFNGEEVTDRPIDFRTRDVDGLEIVLTCLGASVSGVVADTDGSPARDYSVVVFAADPVRWAFPSRFVALARPNQDGRFKVQRLPPADYLCIALPVVQGSEWQDPEFLERLVREATPFTLAAGESRTLDLKLTRPR